jgi:hypothetical protein
MNLRRLLALVVIVLFAAPAASAEAAKEQETVLLVHVTAPLDKDTGRTVLVFRVIATALKKGHHVVLLFDAEGVSSLKMGRWFGGHSTPLDRVPLSEPDRDHLAAALGTTPDGIPDIYGSLLHYLKGRGLAVYVSKRALELHRINTDQYDHAAEAVAEARIVDLLTAATAYLSY